MHSMLRITASALLVAVYAVISGIYAAKKNYSMPVVAVEGLLAGIVLIIMILEIASA